jgi:hypothetical protein
MIQVLHSKKIMGSQDDAVMPCHTMGPLWYEQRASSRLNRSEVLRQPLNIQPVASAAANALQKQYPTLSDRDKLDINTTCFAVSSSASTCFLSYCPSLHININFRSSGHSLIDFSASVILPKPSCCELLYPSFSTRVLTASSFASLYSSTATLSPPPIDSLLFIFVLAIRHSRVPTRRLGLRYH